MKKIFCTLIISLTLLPAVAQVDFTAYSSAELNLIFDRPIFPRRVPPTREENRLHTYFRGGYQVGVLAKRHLGNKLALRTGLGFTQVHYQSGHAGLFSRGDLVLKEVVQPITGNIVAISVDYKQVVLPIFLHLQKKSSNHGPYVGASIVRSFGLNKTYHDLSGSILPFARAANFLPMIYYPHQESVTAIVPEIGYSYSCQIRPKHSVVIDPYIKQAFQRRWTDFRRMTTIGLRLAYKPNFGKA